MADLVANDAHEFGSIGFFGALWNAPFESIALGCITTGSDDRSRCDQHARSGDDALVDCLLEFRIRIGRAFRTQVADGREAGH